MAKEIGTVEQALQDLKEGKVILVIDDPDRENEGDLICAAEFATTENVNFMATDAKGLICMPMSGEMCDRLGLEQMVSVNTDNHCTAFTVSIDHVDTTTGISAAERSYTALKTVEEGARASDFRIRDICSRFGRRKGAFLCVMDTRKQPLILCGLQA